MAGLTLAQLRSLARMYRAGVDGAAQQLLELAQVRPDVLASLLHVTHVRADLDEDVTARCIADRLDELDRTRRSVRKSDIILAARKLAETLGRNAQWEGGRVHLDPHLLRALVATQVAGALSFERAGEVAAAIDLAYLRRVLDACRTCRLTELYVESASLVLVYASIGARGRFRLTLCPPDTREEQVRVRLEQHTPVVDAPTIYAVRHMPRPHVARRFLDALSAQVGW